MSVKVIHTLSATSIYYSIIISKEVSDLWAVSGWDFPSAAVGVITGVTGGAVMAVAGSAVIAAITGQGAAEAAGQIVDAGITAAGEITAVDRYIK